MKNKKIIIIAIIIAVGHFILTSVIGHYISVSIGTQMGNIVAGGLVEASEKNSAKAEEDANRIYQNMKSKIDVINERWEITNLLISLPAKPLFSPLLKEMSKKQINKVITNEITHEQFRTQALMMYYSANFLNSLLLGFLLYIIMIVFNQHRKER